MTWASRIALAIVAVAPAACRGSIDMGGLGLVTEPDSGLDAAVQGDAAVPGDGLEVFVVDDRPFRGTGLPVEGARVIADDGGGRHEALTDAEGRARIEGLDLDADPPDLTLVAPGYAWLTIVELGSMGPVPQPLVIGLGAHEFCPACELQTVTGPCTPLVDGSTIVASLPGGYGESSSESYLAYGWPDLESPIELTGVEVADGHVVGFGRAECHGDECTAELPTGPSLTLEATPTATVAVTLQLDVPDDHPLAEGTVSVRVQEADARGLPIAVLGLSPRVDPGAVSVEYADLVRGDLAVWAEMRLDTNDGHLFSAAHLPMDAAELESLQLHAPPAPSADLVELPSDPIELEPSEWAQARGVYLTDRHRLVWVVLAPPGLREVRLPLAPPTEVILVNVSGAWDEDPWEDLRLLAPGWPMLHLRALAYDATSLGVVP